MKIKYIGPCTDGVYVPAANLEAKPGDVIDVDDALGASMCEQTINWQAVPAKSTTPKES